MSAKALYKKLTKAEKAIQKTYEAIAATADQETRDALNRAWAEIMMAKARALKQGEDGDGKAA